MSPSVYFNNNATLNLKFDKLSVQILRFYFLIMMFSVPFFPGLILDI